MSQPLNDNSSDCYSNKAVAGEPQGNIKFTSLQMDIEWNSMKAFKLKHECDDYFHKAQACAGMLKSPFFEIESLVDPSEDLKNYHAEAKIVMEKYHAELHKIAKEREELNE